MHVSTTPRAAPAECFLLSIPAIALGYPAIVLPLLMRFVHAPDLLAADAQESGLIESRLFWPALAVTAVFLSFRISRGGRRPVLAPHLLLLLCYLALASASVLWSHDPATTFRRAIQQMLIIISVVLPVLMSRDPDEILEPLFTCLSVVVALNLLFVAAVPPSPIGHTGVYAQKNTLGLTAALAFIVSLFQIVHTQRLSRRLLATAVLLGSLALVQASGSKTALGIAVLAPLIGLVIHWTVVALAVSPATILLYLLTVLFTILFLLADALDISAASVFLVLFSDETFTGRTAIWSFALSRIAQHPVFGWGYQAFWSAGPEAPSREGPDWVAEMPHAHNGYLDAALEVGLIGLMILVAFIVATLHACRSLVRDSPATGWLAISLVLFVTMVNFMESTFFRTASKLWLITLIAAALAATQRARAVARGRSGKVFEGVLRTSESKGAPENL